MQDDVSVEGWGRWGRGRRAEDEVTHTRFSSHSSRNCWNFWDISSWALPTALRIFPRTAGEGEKKNTHGSTCVCAHAQARTRDAITHMLPHTAAVLRR